MKKSTIIILALVGAILLLGIVPGVLSYNSLVTKEEKVTTALSNIDVQLERRASLIPNLVNSVKGYMTHEQSVIDSITDARENLVNANSIKEKSDANNELTSALNNLYLVVENYPTLKADTAFIGLQDELAGSENRIAVARKDYNDVVTSYNTEIKKFPKNMFAKMFGFEAKDYFEAADSSKDTPDVSFD